MENPATWGPAEKIINSVLQEWVANNQRPPEARRFGLSLPKQITVALRDGQIISHEYDTLNTLRDKAREFYDNSGDPEMVAYAQGVHDILGLLMVNDHPATLTDEEVSRIAAGNSQLAEVLKEAT